MMHHDFHSDLTDGNEIRVVQIISSPAQEFHLAPSQVGCVWLDVPRQWYTLGEFHRKNSDVWLGSIREIMVK